MSDLLSTLIGLALFVGSVVGLLIIKRVSPGWCCVVNLVLAGGCLLAMFWVQGWWIFTDAVLVVIYLISAWAWWTTWNLTQRAKQLLDQNS